MDARRWERIQALFEAALELPEEERAAFLSRECADDEALRSEATALLAADATESPLLDRGIERVAGRLVGGVAPAGRVGRRIGSYRLTGLVGEGGMGVVYEAERVDVGGRVAIKILRDAALSPARRDRFLGEQRTLAQLNHPSIGQLHDADALPDGTPWFAMEYVEGLPLTDYCKRRGTSIEGRLLLLRTVAAAVQHAHRHLIVHRDLKPSNILVREDGTVKLLDFGIAKQLEGPGADVTLTRAGQRLMTPAYAAPEQLLGERVGVHTDVYSLGVILYELVAGRLPFDIEGRSPAEIERIVTGTEPPKPSAVRGRRGSALDDGRATYADLDVLCLTAMHPDPARRYPTVEALVRDIDHLLAGEPLEARADTVGYRAGKFVRRNRRGLGTAAVVVAVLVGLVGFYTVRLARARDAAAAEAARVQRVQSFLFSLFQGGDELAGPAESLRVVTLLERGVQQARMLDAEPGVQAELALTLGGIYRELGELERADSLLGSALAQRRHFAAATHPDVAVANLALADLRVDQARLDEADSLSAAGLAALRRTLPPDDARVLRALLTRGRVYEERGLYDSARSVLTEAVARYEEASAARATPSDSGTDPGLSAALTQLGNTSFYAGDMAAADSLFRRVLALDRRLFGDRHPTVSDALVNVGAVAHELGRYPEAEDRYREALSITREFYGGAHPKTASNLTMLGRNLVFQDRLDEAETVLREAVTLQEAIYGEEHPVVASTVNELGTTALLNGRLDEADAAYRRMEQIYRRVHPDGHWLIGIALSNRASVELRRERYDRAATLFEKAVASFTATQGPEALNTGIGRIKLGRALLRLGRPADAAREVEAGYDVLVPRVEPDVSWLQAAREDLASAYETLGDTVRAARFRAEHATYAADAAGR